MKSVFALTLAIFLIAVIPHIYAEEEQAPSVTDPKKECILKYLSCKDNCDYFDDKTAATNCKNGCDKQFSCRPEKKKYKIPSLYE